MVMFSKQYCVGHKNQPLVPLDTDLIVYNKGKGKEAKLSSLSDEAHAIMVSNALQDRLLLNLDIGSYNQKRNIEDYAFKGGWMDCGRVVDWRAAVEDLIPASRLL